MIHGLRLRSYLDQQTIADQLTQTTDTIKAINTGPLSAPVVEPPASQNILIAEVHPVIVNITPFSRNIILSALRMICRDRYIWWKQQTRYRIVNVLHDPMQPGQFVACLEREDA